MVWLWLGALWLPLMFLGEFIVRRMTPSSEELIPRSPRLVAVRFATLGIAGALTWWLLDVPGMLRLNEALRTMDRAAIVAAKPHPLVPTDSALISAVWAAICVAWGVYTLMRPDELVERLGESAPSSQKSILLSRVFGAATLVMGLLLGANSAWSWLN